MYLTTKEIYMKPLDLFNHYKKSKNDLIADCILQTLNDFKGPITTCALVIKCLDIRVSSPATTHKKLMQLKKLGLVQKYDHPSDSDSRRRYVSVSRKGTEYLSKWKDMAK
jgi:DNA-binding MarR family transcriptional regulator